MWTETNVYWSCHKKKKKKTWKPLKKPSKASCLTEDLTGISVRVKYVPSIIRIVIQFIFHLCFYSVDQNDILYIWVISFFFRSKGLWFTMVIYVIRVWLIRKLPRELNLTLIWNFRNKKNRQTKRQVYRNTNRNT